MILPGPGEDGEVRMRPSVSKEMDKRCACNRVVNMGMKNGRPHGHEVYQEDHQGKGSSSLRSSCSAAQYGNKVVGNEEQEQLVIKNVYDQEQGTGSRGQFSGIISRLPVGSCS